MRIQRLDVFAQKPLQTASQRSRSTFPYHLFTDPGNGHYLTCGVGYERLVHVGDHICRDSLFSHAYAVGFRTGYYIFPCYAGEDVIVFRMGIQCFIPNEKDIECAPSVTNPLRTKHTQRILCQCACWYGRILAIRAVVLISHLFHRGSGVSQIPTPVRLSRVFLLCLRAKP